MCDDGVSFPPLESGLEAVLDPSLTTVPLVAPSSPSTLREHTAFSMTSLDPPLPFAQSTAFEIGETLSVRVSVDEEVACYDSDSSVLEVHDSDALVAGMSYVDVVLTVPTSSVMIGDVTLDPLYTSHASLLCSCLLYTSPSPRD